ncbi:MAG: hypothetical protein ACOVNR_04520 [Chitinophagaceae bacterium]
MKLFVCFYILTFFSCAKSLERNNASDCGSWQKVILDGKRFKPISVVDFFTAKDYRDTINKYDSCFFNTVISFKGDSFYVTKTGNCNRNDSGIYKTYRTNNINYLDLKYTSGWFSESAIFQFDCDSFVKAGFLINTPLYLVATREKYAKQ